MKSRTTKKFRELFGGLPKTIQRQARQAYRMFLRDPSHPGLRFKQVHPEPPTYSARVGIGYRAVAFLEGDSVVWFWSGPTRNTIGCCALNRPLPPPSGSHAHGAAAMAGAARG